MLTFVSYKSNCAPINNHHPLFTSIKAYPYLGRQLTSEDIGKWVIRVYPQKTLTHYDWSYIPEDTSEQEAKIKAIKLKSLNPLIFKNHLIIFQNHKIANFLTDLSNDPNWLPLDEWLAIPNKDSTELQNPRYSEGAKIDEIKEIEPSRESSRVLLHGNRKAYPYLGRQLGSDDIGKLVIRVYPVNLSNGHSNWSYIPEDSSEESARLEAERLSSITPMILEELPSNVPNDDHWLTLDEWLAIPYKDSTDLKNPNFSQRKKFDDTKKEELRQDKNYIETLNEPIFEPTSIVSSNLFSSPDKIEFSKTHRFLSKLLHHDSNYF